MISPGDRVTVSGRLSPFYFSDPEYQAFLSDLTKAGVNYNFDYNTSVSDTSDEALVIISSPVFLVVAIEGSKALLLNNDAFLTTGISLLQQA